MVLYPLGLPTTTSHPAWRPAGKTTQSHLVYRRTEDSLRLSNIRCVDVSFQILQKPPCQQSGVGFKVHGRNPDWGAEIAVDRSSSPFLLS